MHPFIATTLVTFTTVMITMTLVWLISLMKRDASIADVAWGAVFVLIAALSLFINGANSACSRLLTTLVAVWGIRLTWHLFWRNARHGEDRRYSEMRSRHGHRFWWLSLVTVFYLQGAIAWFVSLPIQAACTSERDDPLGWLDYIGLALWAIGIAFESIGDWQLERFRRDPANAHEVLDRGVWRYTRHPNYFGDFCVWWGLYFIACSSGGAWTLASPALMSYLLLKISGVGLLERNISERRPGYAAYRMKTSVFFPWLPRNR